MSADVWPAGQFLIAAMRGPDPVSGYVYRGLGIYRTMGPSPKGRRPAEWSLTHLGTGFAVCGLRGDVRTAFPVATEIAECGDWDWDGLEGFRNRDPEIGSRALAVIKAHPKVTFIMGGVGSDDERHASACAVAEARA